MLVIAGLLARDRGLSGTVKIVAPFPLEDVAELP
jgi:hypothetical protein